jgi:ferritin-like metal-binding protein YciE
MEKMTDLKALLAHEVEDLISAEEQIIDAMPSMIEKAKNPLLKKSLQQHLRVTEQQLKRVEKVQKLLGKENGKNKGGFLGLFGGSSHECKGTKGIIDEGKKIMGEDMDSDVMDAAIIASAQKIEHYEICGYGTAKAYAEELGLKEVVQLLEQTLNEEYDADFTLTELAVSRVNKEAEASGEQKTPAERGMSRNGSGERSTARSSSTPAKSNGRTATSGRASSNGNSKGGNKSAAKKSAPKKAAAKKGGRATAKSR